MSIPNFIAKLTNPFDDLENIKKLVEAYSGGNYYSNVVRSIDPDKTIGVNTTKDMNEFYVTTYTKWRDDVVNMTKEEFEALKAKGKLKNDFIRVREFIRKCPLPQTKEDVMNILYAKKDNDLMDALDHYNPFEQVQTSWTYLASRYYDNRKSSAFPIAHRLYLNIDSDAVHKVVTELFNKCYEYGITYEFKFSEAANRGDSLVIYCSNDNILLFVKLLELIKKEHPELVDKFHKPPIFTGVYDGWIGYGEEYKNAKSSYNSDRCDIIEERLNGHFNNWRCKAGNLRFQLNNNNVSIIDYIAHQLCEEFFKQQREQYKMRNSSNTNRSKGNIDLLNSQQYRDQITNAIRLFITSNANKIFSQEELTNDSCEVTNIFGEKSRIYISKVKYALRQIFVNSVSNNKKVLEFFRDDFKMEFKRRDLSDRVIMSNETLNNMIKYQSDKLKGHRVIAARKADNRKIYKAILEVFDEAAVVISNNIDSKDLDRKINPYFNKFCALKSALDKVGIYSFSGSSIDEDERAQYYIYRMYRALDRCNVKEYEHFRNLTLAYDEILESGKKL